MGNLTAKTSGEIASFMTPAKTNIKSLKVHFSPKQLGTGDPSPENVREIEGWDGVEVNGSGKNLLINDDPLNPNANYYKHTSTNPVIFSESEKAFTVRKTIEDIGNVGICEANHAKINATKSEQSRLFVAPQEATYIFSVEYKNVGANYGLRFYKVVNDKVTRLGDIHGDADEQWHIRSFTVSLNKGDSFKLFIYPNIYWRNMQIEIANTPTDYKPYQGNTISYQWKLPDEYQEVEYIESDGGQYIDLPFGFDDTDEIHAKVSVSTQASQSDKYIVSPKQWNTNKNRFGIGVYNVYTFAFGGVTTSNTRLTPNVNNDGQLHEWIYKDRIAKLVDLNLIRDLSSIEFGETTKSLKLFYGYNSNTLGKIAYYKHKKANGDEYEFIPCYRKSDGEIGMYDTVSQTFYTNQGTGTFLKGNDVDKTFYGGYVDLISGELVETNVRDVLDAVNKEVLNPQYNTNQTVFFRCDTDYTFETKKGTVTGISDFYCENLKPASMNWGKGDSQDSTVNTITERAGSTKAVCMRMYNSIFDINADDTVEVKKQKINIWLAENPIIISYKLAEPITYQLTPVQLKSFIGQNNFWSNADYVEIEYDLIETEDIQKCRKKIILNQPHTESVIGDVANFTTNMKAPLKECKVYFSPIQEGSGDPSPDNVRNIIGWDGVNVTRCGKNLFGGDALYQSYLANSNNKTVGEDENGKYIYVYNERSDTALFSDFKPNTQYTFISKIKRPTSTSISGLRVLYTDGTQEGALTGKITDGLGYFKWKTNKNKSVKKFYFLQRTIGNYYYYENFGIFEGDVNIEDYEPYNGATTPISWQSDYGTVYGGYVDLVKGELVAEWYKLTFDGINQKMNRDYTDDTYIRCNQVYFSPAGRYGSSILCNNLPLFIQTAVTKTPCFWSVNNGKKFGGIVLGTKEEYPDLAEATAQQRIDYVNNWLKENPTTVVYKLAEPIHYQLTPQQLLTFKETNNIWSNSNGQIEVKFWTH